MSDDRGRLRALKMRAMTLSLLVGIVLLAVKFAAWLVTGSAAVLSDAAESIINVVASSFAWVSIRIAAIPADENHPYGHGKIEYFSAGFEGGLIVIAALGIVWAAIHRLVDPQPLQSLGLGILLTAGAAAANLLVGLYLVRVGKSSGSLAIAADGKHLLTDVVTSAGVVVGLVIVRLTGLAWLDPVIALALAVNILIAGWRLVQASAARLMDAADEDLLDRIVDALAAVRGPGDIQPHQLRARHHGDRLAVDFHLFMPRFWELTRVHSRVDAIEADLRSHIGAELEAIIHVDPCEPRHCSTCALEGCPVRSAPQETREPWRREEIASSGRHPDF